MPFQADPNQMPPQPVRQAPKKKKKRSNNHSESFMQSEEENFVKQGSLKDNSTISAISKKSGNSLISAPNQANEPQNNEQHLSYSQKKNNFFDDSMKKDLELIKPADEKRDEKKQQKPPASPEQEGQRTGRLPSLLPPINQSPINMYPQKQQENNRDEEEEESGDSEFDYSEAKIES